MLGGLTDKAGDWRITVRQSSNPKRELNRLLSVSELANLLQILEKTVYEWRCRGEGPVGIRVGRYLDWIRPMSPLGSPLASQQRGWCGASC